MRALVLVMTACLFPGVAFADPLADNQARFGQLTGTVQVLSQGSSEWIHAHADLPIESGDDIRVEEDSEAELSMAQNVLFLLSSGTEVIAGHISAQEGHLTVRRGALLAKMDSTHSPIGAWELETPVSVCAIRGTEFLLLHSEEEGTHVGVFDGAVQFRPAENAVESFPPVMINAREEGVLEKKKPMMKLTHFSPVVRRHFQRVPVLRERYQRTARVWVPLTREYRQELRRKFVAPPKPRKAPPRRSAPPRRRHP